MSTTKTIPVYPLEVELTHAYNPDIDGGYWVEPLDPGQPRKVSCVSISEASRICKEYIDRNELGGGNWTGGTITDAEGDTVAKIAYNGRAFVGQEFHSWPSEHPLSPSRLSPEEVAIVRELDAMLKAGAGVDQMSAATRAALGRMSIGNQAYYAQAMLGVRHPEMELVELEVYPAVERKVGPESEWGTEGLYSMPGDDEKEVGEGIEYFWSGSIRCADLTEGRANTFVDGQSKGEVVGKLEALFGDDIKSLLCPHSTRSRERFAFMHNREEVAAKLDTLHEETSEGVKI
jgi:hypothetical protein